jgi:hypothetical protein
MSISRSQVYELMNSGDLEFSDRVKGRRIHHREIDNYMKGQGNGAQESSQTP